MFGNPHRRSKSVDRQINRHLRMIAGRSNEHNANSRAATRRRKQMLSGQATASNGVVINTDADNQRPRRKHPESHHRCALER